jgi:flagella basal body P-ring formation protein FlgA
MKTTVGLVCRTAAALLLALAGTWAGAQTTAPAEPASGLDSGLEQQVRALALSSTKATHAAGAPRVEVSVGQLDPRLRLAPCQHVEPYLPDGMRMWGRSRIGLRCTQGSSKWNVYLPITVRVFGTALVARSGISAGAVLAADDLAQAEVDLAEDSSAPLVNADLAVGRTLARPLKPGQSLRQSHLKARQWFAAGETVTVLAQGEGFSVAGEAQALNPGIEGQPVRVRTEGGRVLTGLPVGERRVELPL